MALSCHQRCIGVSANRQAFFGFTQFTFICTHYAESVPKEGWSEVEFLVQWEQKEIVCLALGLESFETQAGCVGSFLDHLSTSYWSKSAQLPVSER